MFFPVQDDVEFAAEWPFNLKVDPNNLDSIPDGADRLILPHITGPHNSAAQRVDARSGSVNEAVHRWATIGTVGTALYPNARRIRLRCCPPRRMSSR